MKKASLLTTLLTLLFVLDRLRSCANKQCWKRQRFNQ